MKNTMGQIIAAKRKELGMTQLELAEKMGVTDKAVSKWERDLSYPDVNSLPKLAEIFDMTVDELMRIGDRFRRRQTDGKRDNLYGYKSRVSGNGRIGYNTVLPRRYRRGKSRNAVGYRPCLRRHKPYGEKIKQ